MRDLLYGTNTVPVAFMNSVMDEDRLPMTQEETLFLPKHTDESPSIPTDALRIVTNVAAMLRHRGMNETANFYATAAVRGRGALAPAAVRKNIEQAAQRWGTGREDFYLLDALKSLEIALSQTHATTPSTPT
jgi:hypothetical protein